MRTHKKNQGKFYYDNPAEDGKYIWILRWGKKVALIMGEGRESTQFTFAADMQVWQNMISLKETNLQINEDRNKERAQSRTRIEGLLNQIEEKKRTIENLALNLRQEKDTVKKLSVTVENLSITVEKQETFAEQLKKELNDEKNMQATLKDRLEEEKKLMTMKRSLAEVRQSTTFKIGKIIMWIPRKIKNMLKK